MTTPVYHTRKLKRRFFGLKVERPMAAPGQVLVLTGGHAPIVLWPGQKATPGEAAWSGYDTVYEIDTGWQEMQVTGSLPAKGGDVSFQVALSASYKISDPVRIINEGIDQPETMIRRVLLESMGRVAEQHDIENVQEARAAIREMLEKGKYTEKLPFDLSGTSVQLNLDDEARNFLKRRRQQKWDAVLVRESATVTEATGESDRKKQENQLALDQERRIHEIEMQRRMVEAELEIQRMRMEVYKPMIQGGLWTVLVQQLAQKPDDIARVSELILQLHAQKVSADVSMLQALMDGDMINDRHLRDVTENLVRSLRSNMGSGPLGLPLAEEKQLPTPEPGATHDATTPPGADEAGQTP